MRPATNSTTTAAQSDAGTSTGSEQASPWQKLLRWRRNKASSAASASEAPSTPASENDAALNPTIATTPILIPSNNNEMSTSSSTQRRTSSARMRKTSGLSISSMNSTIFGFGFLDIPTGDNEDDNDEEANGFNNSNNSNPTSPLPPLSPAGFGFADAQLARVAEAMATPSSAHHKMFERTASSSTIYGFVDLGVPILPVDTVGIRNNNTNSIGGTFEHFLGASRYPTTHKLNPLLFDCDIRDGPGGGEAIFANDAEHDGNFGDEGFIFGGVDDWTGTEAYTDFNNSSSSNSSNSSINKSLTTNPANIITNITNTNTNTDSDDLNVSGYFTTDREISEEASPAAAVAMVVPGYDEGHYSVCIGQRGKRDSLVFWGADGDEGGYC